MGKAMLSFNCDKDIAVLVTLINFLPEFYVVFKKDRLSSKTVLYYYLITGRRGISQRYVKDGDLRQA